MSKNNAVYTEENLFTLISEGDEEAFNRFYFTLLPGVSPYLFKLLKAQDAVKEVLQEALIRFWLNRHKLREIDNPKAWLLRIISNECYRFLRKQNDRQQKIAPLDQHPESNNILLYQTEMDTSFRETRQIIRGAVTTLSPRQKTIYQLSREEGLTIPEIAKQLNLSNHYVKKTLMLSLHIIQQKLMEAGRFIPLILLIMQLQP